MELCAGVEKGRRLGSLYVFWQPELFVAAVDAREERVCLRVRSGGYGGVAIVWLAPAAGAVSVVSVCGVLRCAPESEAAGLLENAVGEMRAVQGGGGGRGGEGRCGVANGLGKVRSE